MLLQFLYNQTGAHLFGSRIFSTAFATVSAFLLAMAAFPLYIRFLQKLKFSSELTATPGKHDPVMPAGILFLLIIVPTCFITCRFNSYVISALIIYVFFGVIGAVDDVAKIINKRRLAKGLITKQDYQYKSDGISSGLRLSLYILISFGVAIAAYKYIPNINGLTNVPFFSAEKFLPYLPFWLFIPFMTLVIAVLANGVNFTDGFDTLAAVPLMTCSVFIAIVAYASSNRVWSTYLLIPFIPGIEEILPFVGAIIGVLLSFLWFNSPPSTIIMGDSGSVGLGGVIALFFIFVKAQFYLPIVGFIFLLEFVSDIIQISWFKMTRKRVFLMAPIHHHFQIKMRKQPLYSGNELWIKSKIAWRFHIISVILMVVGLMLFLKIR